MVNLKYFCRYRVYDGGHSFSLQYSILKKTKMKLLTLLTIISISFASISFSMPAATIVNSYPSNGAKNVKTATSIGITYSAPIDHAHFSAVSVQVRGERHGTIGGTVTISSNNRTLIFKPEYLFAAGEKITVTVKPLLTTNGILTEAFTSTFTTAAQNHTIDTSYHSDDPVLEVHLHKKIHTNKGTDRSVAYLPDMLIITNNLPMEGNIFLANFKFSVPVQTNTYQIILDKDGNVVRSAPGSPDYYNDFKPHPNGTYSYFDALKDVFYITDTAFNIIDSVTAANGYETDGHELRYTPDGNYIILAADYETVDMSKIVQGGDTAALVLIPVIQEFDKQKNLVFEWRSIDHFQITDATHEKLTANTIDYCHANAIEFDADSNILLSSRHMDEITKIDHTTGEILWRMGGKHNQFTFLNDTIPFSHQHAIRRTATGTYTLFDNGNYRSGNKGPFSRAIEYQFDETNKAATVIWQYRHDPDVYGMAMGYVQRLPNGNSFIGWGACSDLSVSEISPDNKAQFELQMDDANFSYRAYKFEPSYITSGITAGINSNVTTVAPCSLSLSSNPIIGTAQLGYSVSQAGHLTISLYNLLGEMVLPITDRSATEGIYSAPLPAQGLTPGVYYIRANLNGYTATQKIVIAE